MVDESKDLPLAPVIPAASAPLNSTAGFFQSPPKLHNQFYEDVALRRAFNGKVLSRVLCTSLTFESMKCTFLNEFRYP